LRKKEKVFGATKGKGCKGRVFWIFGEDSKDLAASLEGNKESIVLWCARA